MTRKVCLRCDWSGDTEERACPRCGTELYEAPSAPAPAPTAQGSVVAVDGSRLHAWRARAVVACIVAFALLAFAFVQLHPGPATGVASVEGRDGYLLVSATGFEGVRLWTWDLATGTARRGPPLAAMPSELVESVSLRDTWVGLTTLTRRGLRSASVLRRLGPTDRPIVVARGRFVAWTPVGGYVSVVRSRPLGGCRHRLDVRTWFVTIGHEERRFDDPVCGRPVAFGRDRLVPYLALDGPRDLRIAQVGNGYLETRLRGRTILSVSNDGDLLVQAPEGPLELWFQPSAPIKVGTGRLGLLPDEVLAWSPDGSQAYVLGTQDGLHGVYRLTVGPRPRPRRPELITATSALNVAATTGANGDLFLVTDGVVRRWHDGVASTVPLPPGAAPPVGPILWVSTLPYSTPES